MYANRLLRSGLSDNIAQIQGCVDTIVNSWPMISSSVTMQVITPLMQNQHWRLLGTEEQRRMKNIVYATVKSLSISPETQVVEPETDDTANQLFGQDKLPGPTLDLAADHQATHTRESEASSHVGGNPALLSILTEFEPAGSRCIVPDLMYGTLFTSFLEPGYGNSEYHMALVVGCMDIDASLLSPGCEREP